MRATSSPSWLLKQSEIAMGSGLRLIEETEFRLSQNPYLTYFNAKKEAIDYAKMFAIRLI
jgi:hypothetical protein